MRARRLLRPGGSPFRRSRARGRCCSRTPGSPLPALGELVTDCAHRRGAESDDLGDRPRRGRQYPPAAGVRPADAAMLERAHSRTAKSWTWPSAWAARSPACNSHVGRLNGRGWLAISGPMSHPQPAHRISATPRASSTRLGVDPSRRPAECESARRVPACRASDSQSPITDGRLDIRHDISNKLTNSSSPPPKLSNPCRCTVRCATTTRCTTSPQVLGAMTHVLLPARRLVGNHQTFQGLTVNYGELIGLHDTPPMWRCRSAGPHQLRKLVSRGPLTGRNRRVHVRSSLSSKSRAPTVAASIVTELFNPLPSMVGIISVFPRGLT